jgi:hypothetical protein
MATITLEIPDELAERADELQARLSELLALSLDPPTGIAPTIAANVEQIVELLTSQPTPQQLLALQPSADLQARVDDLLGRAQAEALSTAEAAELERYLFLEHLVRMAKAHALQRLAGAA